MEMATSLRLIFSGAAGKNVSFTYPNANGSAGATQVKVLMQGMVDNRGIFAVAPLGIVGAEFVSRSVAPVDLS